MKTTPEPLDGAHRSRSSLRIAVRPFTDLRSLATLLVVALVLAAAGAGWWYSRHYPRASGPEEPMCLAFTQEDVQPFIRGLRRLVRRPDCRRRLHLGHRR